MNNKVTKNGKLCISQCYPPGYRALHPITLKTETMDRPFCFIQPYFNTTIGDYVIADECDEQVGEILPQDNLVIPYLGFDHVDFLANCYNIHNFVNTFEWVNENQNLPEATIVRVINASWKAFGHLFLDKSVNILEPHQMPKNLIDYYAKETKTNFDKAQKILEDYISKYAVNIQKWSDISSHHYKIKNYFEEYVETGGLKRAVRKDRKNK